MSTSISIILIVAISIGVFILCGLVYGVGGDFYPYSYKPKNKPKKKWLDCMGTAHPTKKRMNEENKRISNSTY